MKKFAKKSLALFMCMLMCILAIPFGAITVSAGKLGDLTYNITDGEVTITYCVPTATSVEIPTQIEGYPVTKIGTWAFEGCNFLTSIAIPNSVIDIGHDAFYDCPELVLVTISNSVTSIGDNAFSNCGNLTSIMVDKNSKSYCDINGVLFNKDKTLLIKYPQKKVITNYTIPSSVNTIKAWSFEYCQTLTSVTIPNSVTSIGKGAFYECKKLTPITIPDSVMSIGEYAFGYYYDSSFKVTNGYTICGYTGSVAETYAKNNNITFKSIGTAIKKGDSDGNNKVDAVDAALTLKYFTLSMTGKTMPTAFDKSAADVDGSGKVDAVDAALTLKYFTKNMSGSFTWSDIIGK